jgi:hypothetical protein
MSPEIHPHTFTSDFFPLPCLKSSITSTSETAAAHDSDTNISELEKQLKELQMER